MHLSDDAQNAVLQWLENKFWLWIHKPEHNKQLKQYIISCKTVANALKITVSNIKTSSASGGFAPWPRTGGTAPWTPAVGSAPDPRARHGCVYYFKKSLE